MIHIEKDQRVAENEDLRVSSNTGDYEDGALIEFYTIDNPKVSLGLYEAHYVKYGGIVYRFNTPEELGKALLDIDPACTHDSALLYQEDEARRVKREKGTLKPDSPVPADVTPDQQVISDLPVESLPMTPNIVPVETPSVEIPTEIPIETPSPMVSILSKKQKRNTV